MAYWSWVNCNCPNSFVLPGIKQISQLYDYQNTPSDVYNRHTCGHRNGNFYEIWPGDIFEISKFLKELYKGKSSPFVIFDKIIKFQLYVDEMLYLDVEEARAWKEEITRLLQMMHSTMYDDELVTVMQSVFGTDINIAWKAIANRKLHRVRESFFRILKSPNSIPFPYKDDEEDLELLLAQEEAFQKIHVPFASAEMTYQLLFKQHLDSLMMYQDVDARLLEALNLCYASETTNNPITIEI